MMRWYKPQSGDVIQFKRVEVNRIETHSNEAGDGAELLVDDLERFDDGFCITDVALVSLQTGGIQFASI
jgi:hypothetical protein